MKRSHHWLKCCLSYEARPLQCINTALPKRSPRCFCSHQKRFWSRSPCTRLPESQLPVALRAPSCRTLGDRQHWIDHFSIRSIASDAAVGTSTPSAASKANADAHMRRKLEAFKEMLEDPDHIFIGDTDARKQYGLSKSDVATLTPALVKDCPYGRPIQVNQYSLVSVIELATNLYGKEHIIEHHRRYLLRHTMDPHGHKAQSQMKVSGGLYLIKPRWYSTPSTTTTAGRDSVRQGLISNSIICTIKGGVWFWTGSHAVFADLMHSAADVANYGYRIFQLDRTVQNGDHMHPYGYAPLRYITADRSFVILAGLGFVVPFSHSIQELFHMTETGVQATVLSPDVIVAPAVVFLVSMVLEGVAMRTAYQEITAQSLVGMTTEESEMAEWRRSLRYILHGPDVMSVATFLEASSGIVGAGVGLGGLGLSWYYGTTLFDVGASVIMASAVGVVSTFLLQRSGSALLGRTLPMSRVIQLVEKLEERATITGVYDVKTEVLGTDTVRFKAEVQFNAEEITQSILGVGRKSHEHGEQDMHGEQMDDPTTKTRVRLETQLQQIMPQALKGFETREQVENWLHNNNVLFYEALAWEVKNVERQIRRDLSDFRKVHIDLEPW